MTMASSKSAGSHRMMSYVRFWCPAVVWFDGTAVTDEHGVRVNIADPELQKQDNAYITRWLP